jgi:hypothetical protein
MMEEGEEEQADPDDVFTQYCDFAMEEVEEEADAENSIAKDDDALGDVIRDAQRDCESKKEKAKFNQMLEDHKKLLYPSAKDGQKKLGTTLELLQWKTKNGISDKAFRKLLKIQKKMLPKHNELPTTTYEAKKIICPLGLQIEKIHACPNDCILYHGEHENLDKCHVCHASRYKIFRDDPIDVEDEERLKKRIPTKVIESPSLVLVINDTKLLIPCVKCFELGISNICDEGICGKEWWP